MRNRGVILLCAILSVLGITLGTAAADPTGSPTRDTAAKDTPVLVTVPSGASVQIACGNTFNPPAPQGGSMYHYYKNCNGYPIRVTTGYQDATGQITIFGGPIVTVQDQGEVGWYHATTQTNATYSTIIVR